MNSEGGARFEQVTGDNIGKQIAIILDKKVQSAPTVEDRIQRGVIGVENLIYFVTFSAAFLALNVYSLQGRKY